MTTAEKRAELTEAGEPWPSCECHGRPLTWQRDKRRKGGGRFVCRVENHADRWRQRLAARGIEPPAEAVCIPTSLRYACACLREQYPGLSDLELLDELDRQRIMARAGELSVDTPTV